MTDGKSYRVVSFQVEGFKRLEYVRLEPPADEIFVIGGPNRSGKTSSLDAFEALFSGKGAIPAEPIHRGMRRCRIKAELASGETVDLTVELEIGANGTSKLSVLDEELIPIAAPQTFLNGLFSKVSFDPLDFLRMDTRKQDAVLKKLLGLDFTDLDALRERATEERKAKNRDIKNFQERLKAAPRFPSAPGEEQSVAELAAEQKRRLEQKTEHSQLLAIVADAERDVANSEAGIDRTRRRIEELEQQLAAQRALLAESTENLAANRADLFEARAVAEAFVVEDTAEIDAKLATVEETNRQVRANQAHAALTKELDAAERDAERLTDTLTECAEEQARRIAAAKFPVPGLGFDDSGPTYLGLPFDQASHSDKIKISAAIGVELHPGLRVLLIRDGEKIGTQDMAAIRDFAREQHFQVFMERFTESGDGCSVVLEDGRVRTASAAE